MTINVAGTLFTTTADTLRSSGYFSIKLSEPWAQSGGDDNTLFLDRDADAFRVLLSCMRNLTVVLPTNDADLFSRVLLEAEFFCVDWLLHEVKVRAIKNTPSLFESSQRIYDNDNEKRIPFNVMHDILNADNYSDKQKAESNKAAAAFFDERYGGLRVALPEGILPTRHFAKEKPRGPTIKHLLPAAPHDWVTFSAPDPLDDDSREPRYQVIEWHKAVALAACTSADGVDYIDAVINPRAASGEPLAPVWWEGIEGGNLHYPGEKTYVVEGRLTAPEEQLVLASVYCKKRKDWPHGGIWGLSIPSAAGEDDAEA